MMHPLSGADLATLRAVFRDAGPVSRRAMVSGVWTAAYLRWPSTALERALLSSRLPTTAETPSPIFILGHWRSGTTHLYNLLSLADFGYVSPIATGIPWDLFGVGRVFRPLLDRSLPKSRHIDAIPVTPTSPQEDEFALANMTPISYYHAIYFPERFGFHLRRGLFFDGCTVEEIEDWKEIFSYMIRKLTLQQGRRLMVKNPAHTSRVTAIRSIFPDAKIIHIHRDPLEVFDSMRNFYKKLFPVLALQPYDHVDIDTVILDVYSEMMARFVAETADLSDPQFVEIAYADLDSDPLAALQKIYETLDLEGFDAASPVFRRYLEGVQSFKKNVFHRDQATVERVTAAWRPFFERWGYASPQRA